MAKAERSAANKLLAFASGFPDATAGIACAGTSLEKRTVQVGGKSFLFVSPHDAMLKLGDSLLEAVERAGENPDSINAGATGWVTIKFDGAVPIGTLRKWVRESYALFAAKRKR